MASFALLTSNLSNENLNYEEIILANNSDFDELYYYQLMYRGSIFSHYTALYINMFYPLPHNKIQMSFPNGYDGTLPYEYKIEINKVLPENLNIGILKGITALGNIVYYYNVERSICDIIERSSSTPECFELLQKYIEYKKCNISKLKSYAFKLGIIDIIENFIDFEKDDNSF